MSDWKVSLENFNAILSELRQGLQEQNRKLRFNKSFVIASDVASQFYCEKKVEMQYLLGRVETEAMSIGTAAHEKLTEDSVKVKRQELWQKIYGPQQVFALEMFLLAKYNEVLLAGKPDSVLFASGFPLVVFEYKFSQSSVDYPSYHVQAETYGVLLENMGFDTSKLFYAIVVADPKTKGSRQLRQFVVLSLKAYGLKEGAFSVPDAKIYVVKFNREIANKNLNWALAFWENSRKAQLTDNPNKCLRCKYKTDCQKT